MLITPGGTMEHVTSLTKKLVGIHSEHPEEGNSEIAGFLIDYLTEIGLKPIRQRVSRKTYNILCIGKGKLMVNGHTDTVEIGSRWKHKPMGEIAGRRIYGRGTSDTKGNIASFLSALRDHPSDNITISFTAIEESGFTGIEKVMELRNTKLRDIEYGIVLEPTDNKIVSMCKGKVIFEVIARGKAAHGSVPHRGVNAIKKIADVIPKLNFYEQKLVWTKYKALGSPTLNIGKIEGGNAVNIVPDFARILVERRTLPKENPDNIIKEIKKICHPLRVNVLEQDNAAEAHPDSKIVSFMKNILESEDMDTRLYAKNGTTEQTDLLEHGIESVVYGPGQAKQPHRTDEYADIQSLVVGKKIFKKMIAKAEDDPEL